MKLFELLTEGRYDPHRHKAIFMLGGPASGKTYIATKLLSGTGLKVVNVDDFYEWLRTRQGIQGTGFDKELYKYSGNLVQKRMDHYINGRLGIVIDGSGRKIDRLRKTKERLESLGYDTMAIFVNTDVLTALNRNDERPRKVNPNWLRDVHQDIQSKLGDLQRLFNKNFIVIDNTEDPQLDYYQKLINQFINSPTSIREEYQSQEEELFNLYKDLTSNVLRDCQPYLKEVGHPLKVMYRGTEKAPIPFIKKFRSDRKPVDSHPVAQEIYNYLINLANKKANRSNSIFVTGHLNQARMYGSPFVVFPRGKFHYTWHTGLKDWYRSDVHSFITPESLTKSTRNKILDYYEKTFLKTLKRNSRDNFTLKGVIAVSPVSLLTTQDIDTDSEKFQTYLSNLRGDDGSLRAAIESEKEIMLSARNGYIHIPAHHFERYVVPYLIEAGIRVEL